MGEGGGVGQEVEEGSGFGGRRGGFGFDGWASGGAGDAEELPTLALVEVVVGDGLRVRGVEVGGLVEVVGERFLGGLFWYGDAGVRWLRCWGLWLGRRARGGHREWKIGRRA